MDNKKRKLRWQLPFLLLLVVGTIYVIRTNRQATPYQQEEGAILCSAGALPYNIGAGWFVRTVFHQSWIQRKKAAAFHHPNAPKLSKQLKKHYYAAKQ